MISSMTGYAAVTDESPVGGLSLDLRSVNHRYLDIQFRIPDELRLLESDLRERISAHVTRGKVECRISLSVPPELNAMQLDETLLSRLTGLDERVRLTLPDAQSLRVADVLRWPGMLGSDSPPVEILKEKCLKLVDQSLAELIAARTREGEKLKAVLLERARSVEEIVNDLSPRIPQLVSSYQEKLSTRLREAMLDPENDRLKQEVVMFAAKIDVDEELQRLAAHVSEIRRILDKGGSVGKRLDFLMQELNREANTLGSKSADVAITRGAMNLKVLIEQMREQIQNIE
ncbi:MAG: YicC family protein [Betaproteobacteria bacterium]|jgi:uncharacterized protein (TIGR00255 family)|nr:MAG: YicC family protein [Betaproteobacteria bacterium]